MAKKTELMKPETHATPTAQDIIAELNALGNPDKAAHLSRFFKTGKALCNCAKTSRCRVPAGERAAIWRNLTAAGSAKEKAAFHFSSGARPSC